MPVLFNNESGLAENLPEQQAMAALQAGTHEVPLISPQGEVGSAPHEDARQMIAQGYTQPSPEHLTSLLSHAKYSSTGQQLIGAAEQVGRGIAGPLVPMAERALGVKPEDIRGREEAKGDIEKMVEQGTGLVASAFIPGGQAKVLEKIGEGGLKLFGIGEAASTLGKIGSAAAQAAIDNAAFQTGDEVSKAVIKDPDQTASSAIANIGLSAVLGGGIGGALGTVSPIWSATVGPKAENLLRAIANRANGETVPISEDLSTVLKNMEKSGKVIPDEVKAGLSNNPDAHAYFQELKESGTTTGDALRQTMDQFKTDVGDQLKSVFQQGEPTTAFEAGEKAKDVILNKANELHDSISAKYEKVMPHLEAVQIPKEARSAFYDQIVKAGEEFGAKGSPAEGLFKTYAERAAAQDSVAQLKKLNTEIFSDLSVARRAGDFEKARALSQLRDSIKEFQDSQVIKAGEKLEKDGVEGAAGLAKNLLEDRKAADKAYAEFIDKIGDVASTGKLGKVKSHGQLLEALDRVPAAKLADKIFDPKNVEGLRFIGKEFPGVLEPIIQAKKTSMIESATSKGDLMHNQLLNSVNKLPKEVRELMFSKEELNTINASGKILRESGKRLNPSGTAGTWDRLMQNMPAGVGGMASMIMGHGALTGAMLGYAAKFLGRDAPDAAKLSLLKYLGSSGPVDGSAWKAASDYIHMAIKGDNLVKKATKAAIKAGQEVLPKSQFPDQGSRKRLDKKVQEIALDPSPLIDAGGKIGRYMPDHTQSLAVTAGNAMQYLNSLRPKPTKLSPLDTEEPPSRFAEASYERALDIAESPLITMKSIQDGTLTPDDVQHFRTLYPKLYDRVNQQLMGAITDRKTDEEPISYKQRMSLSLFMGQAMDSTMLPQSIMAAQPIPQQPPQQMAQNQPRQHGSLKNVNKLAQGSQTPEQMRVMQKSGQAKA